VRAAGNGNVIIAGSVGSTNTISSFSNRAGTEAEWYLTARGEQVCCLYENGVIKTTVSGGATYTTVYMAPVFRAPDRGGGGAAAASLSQSDRDTGGLILLSTATDRAAAVRIRPMGGAC
jgi:hypothetical protein